MGMVKEGLDSGGALGAGPIPGRYQLTRVSENEWRLQRAIAQSNAVEGTGTAASPTWEDLVRGDRREQGRS